MTATEIGGVATAFVVIGGAIVAVVRWLDKGKITQDIEQLKKDIDEADKEIKSLKDELKTNAAKDQELRERVISIDSANSAISDTMTEMKEMLKEVLVKLEQRHTEINDIKNKISVLETKVA